MLTGTSLRSAHPEKMGEQRKSTVGNSEKVKLQDYVDIDYVKDQFV